ncbi:MULTISPECIES: RNA polymerase sigma factor [Maribacter]|uniref:Sigma-70 family RNA polymerase sigma factor n=1 Tax=Maribacter flavus TaxID=1658664 RepID=A0A5B2TQD9_9FLAO|nr:MULTISPECIES: sigma-70 family RNA polymerase sigma factor [Maribacter]KAA2216762.1 sigma-70 family RNA polymerase sigma factor [Maribacter flavus]MDC6406106.1 sigma-70 family RNA polymerase sigma factor [Maribacter sp. PR66]MEE1973109.1 sigma-70 family RNA polymerase sigma factor [Maribacter flavus]
MQLEQLVERFREKDVSAFETLYGMYSENICGVINTIVKNEVRSQEICQDVFVKIWDNADSYNASKGRFFTWILNIARNAAIDEIRSKSYKNEKKNLSADYFVRILESKEEEVVATVETEGLFKLVRSLKKKCIQLIEMLYFRGYTQKEAAEELAIPVGTVKTRNRSCISKLRENMEIK